MYFLLHVTINTLKDPALEENKDTESCQYPLAHTLVKEKVLKENGCFFLCFIFVYYRFGFCLFVLVQSKY